MIGVVHQDSNILINIHPLVNKTQATGKQMVVQINDVSYYKMFSLNE